MHKEKNPIFHDNLKPRQYDPYDPMRRLVAAMVTKAIADLSDINSPLGLRVDALVWLYSNPFCEIYEDSGLPAEPLAIFPDMNSLRKSMMQNGTEFRSIRKKHVGQSFDEIFDQVPLSAREEFAVRSVREFENIAQGSNKKRIPAAQSLKVMEQIAQELIVKD